MTPERPKVTDEIVMEAAKIMAAKIDADARTIAEAYLHPMDGYELTRALERYAHWDVDRDTMEQLDEMEWEVRRLHDDACRDWVKENNVQPKLRPGETIKSGTVAGVCEHSIAMYQVKEHGCEREGRYLLVNFEDAEREHEAIKQEASHE